MLYLFLFFFFFKQKTAYEMRISDWSSDVCSSDLGSAYASHNSVKVGCKDLALDLITWDIFYVLPDDETIAEIEDDLESIGIRPSLLEDKIGRASCRERVCQYV